MRDCLLNYRNGVIRWENLEILHLWKVILDEDMIENNLEILHLWKVRLDEDMIENIFSGTPCLNDLQFEECYGYRRINIISKSLVMFKFNTFNWFDEYVYDADNYIDEIKINTPHLSALTIQDEMCLKKLLLLNVSSLIVAELLYWNVGAFRHTHKDVLKEKMLKGLLQGLSHVDDITYGGTVSYYLTRKRNMYIALQELDFHGWSEKNVAGICERVADIKTCAQAMKCLTTFSESMGTGFIFEIMSKIMKEHKNPKVLSEGLLWMVFAVDDFGVAHLKLKDVFNFCKDTGLQSSAAVATRNATIKLIGVLLKFVGPDIKAFLLDVMPALLSVVEAECEKNPFEGAAAAPKKTVKASDSVSSVFCGGLDSLPREDNSGKITPELLKGLECSDWKMRSESMEAILMFSFPPEAEGFFGDIGPQMVLKNVRDIHGLALAIVLEPLNSHGAFPEVHDKTRATGTGPTVKTTSKIGKSNGYRSKSESKAVSSWFVVSLNEQTVQLKSVEGMKVVSQEFKAISNGMNIDNSDLTFGIHPFCIEKDKLFSCDNNVEAKGFNFLAPTTHRNSMREEVQALERRLVLALRMFSGHSGLRIKTFWFTDKLIKTDAFGIKGGNTYVFIPTRSRGVLWGYWTTNGLENERDIHGLALAIVLEPLNSHGAFPEVHDKTRATGTRTTVKTTSKIGKSNGYGSKSESRAVSSKGVSAKGSKAVSIMSFQNISGPVDGRLAFTPTEPQRERHPMAQPSVIAPTSCNDATRTGDNNVEAKGFDFLAPTTRRNSMRVLRAI
ncbi:MOR1-like protein isoform X1 [Tanacetum coccineum]